MFPQFSSTTTASIYDAVYAAAATIHKRLMPSLRIVAPYFDHAGYIHAMQAHLEQLIAQRETPPDHFVISFHGIPERYDRTGDPYRQQCEQTTQLLAEAMGWQADEWTLAYQSQFGPERWLHPQTDAVLTGLAAKGITQPLIFAPGFVTDCLETLDELGHEGLEQFVEGGGAASDYHFAPCLNDSPEILDFLADHLRQNAVGWQTDSSLAIPIEPLS